MTGDAGVAPAPGLYRFMVKVEHISDTGKVIGRLEIGALTASREAAHAHAIRAASHKFGWNPEKINVVACDWDSEGGPPGPPDAVLGTVGNVYPVRPRPRCSDVDYLGIKS